MEDIRNVAEAYFHGAGAADEKLTDEFFRSLNIVGAEIEKLARVSSVTRWGPLANTSFQEILAFYYLGKVLVPCAQVVTPFFVIPIFLA